MRKYIILCIVLFFFTNIHAQITLDTNILQLQLPYNPIIYPIILPPPINVTNLTNKQVLPLPPPPTPPSQQNAIDINYWNQSDVLPNAQFELARNFLKGDFNGDGSIDLKFEYNDKYYLLYNKKFEGLYLLPFSSDMIIANPSVENWFDWSGSIDPFQKYSSYAPICCADINGDGKDDLIIGNPNYGRTKYSAHPGRVYIFYGENSNRIYSFDSADVIIDAKDNSEYGSHLGESISTGDINGDGKNDLIIGANRANTVTGTSRGSGEVYVFYGNGNKLSGSISTSSADVTIQGKAPGDNLGFWLHSIYGGSDFNGDGKKDLILGAVGAGDGIGRGEVYVFYGNNLHGTISVSSADLIIQGETNGDGLGQVISGGDMDNDGIDDIIFGCLKGGKGNVSIFYSSNPHKGIIPISSADITIKPIRTWKIDSFDIDNDGRDDLIISDWNYPKVYLFYGDSFPITRINATLDIKPDTLNLESQGNWITAYIELPVNYNLNDVNLNTVRIVKIGNINIEPIYAEIHPTEIGDYDNDGIPDLMVKFNREELQKNIDDSVELCAITVTGKLNDETSFSGIDNIRIIQKEDKDTKQLPAIIVYNNVINPNKNEHVTIKYFLDLPSYVKITIYNIAGEKIKTIVDNYQGAGSFEAIWNGVNKNGSVVGSGLYLINIKTDKINENRKMMVIK